MYDDEDTNEEREAAAADYRRECDKERALNDFDERAFRATRDLERARSFAARSRERVGLAATPHGRMLAECDAACDEAAAEFHEKCRSIWAEAARKAGAL